jgi:hypothetical protein
MNQANHRCMGPPSAEVSVSKMKLMSLVSHRQKPKSAAHELIRYVSHLGVLFLKALLLKRTLNICFLRYWSSTNHSLLIGFSPSRKGPSGKL